VPPPKRGWRVVDGIRWAWFCSKSCSSADARSRMSPERMHHGHRMWRRRNLERRFGELVKTLRSAIDEHGKVEVKTLAKFIVDRERQAYRRGASMMRERFTRDGRVEGNVRDDQRTS
jgi:hypothetical protein